MDGWIELDDPEYDQIWDRFQEQLRFRPSIERRHWPGIAEPTPSATWSVAGIWGEGRDTTRLAHDLAERALAALQSVTPRGGWLYALDWQHEAYRLDPHAPFEWDDPDEDWPVPALPDGDYRVFVAADLGWGWFGHPWEKTICVWGAELLAVVEAAPPLLFEWPVRRNGRGV